ncbi:MAG: MFS transporter [Clostridia bacterium]|nr:MFS transporter [Clostridia bacterium]
MEKSSKLGKNLLFNLILFGFMGQVAWAVENNYFNTFLYNKIGGSPADIANMVAWSSVAAVVTTLVMGTLSDKLNRRKIFISLGYVFWGVTVMAFAFISRENVASLLNISDETKVKLMTINLVIVMDCLMTFMGSTSNDAAFNAWVTDVTNEHNRAKTESILSLLSIFGLVVVTVVFGALATNFGYPACFLGLGLVVTICGLIGCFSIKDSRSGAVQTNSYWSGLIYGFRPSVVKGNRYLYLALLSICFFSIATQVFLPYIFIYLQHHLGFDFNNLNITPTAAVVAVLILVAVVAAVIIIGGLIDKKGKSLFVFPSVLLFVAGLIGCSFANRLSTFGLCAIPAFAGYGLLMIILNAAVRDFTPEDKAGQLQGVRMIFFVLIPMVVGPRIGSAITNRFAQGTYLNEYEESVNIPVPQIYLAAAAVAVLIVIPAVFLFREWKLKERAAKEELPAGETTESADA